MQLPARYKILSLSASLIRRQQRQRHVRICLALIFLHKSELNRFGRYATNDRAAEAAFNAWDDPRGNSID